MDEANIIALRKSAEHAVADMPEGPLKMKAFEVILGNLLEGKEATGRAATAQREPIVVRPPSRNRGQRAEGKVPDSCPERILFLRTEGFFKTPRTLSEIQAELRLRGWIYPVTSLSGPVQKLVQKRELRRLAGEDGKKGSYTYVEP